MTTRSRLILAVHRALLRSARTPLAGVWRAVYRVAARAWAAYLVRGEREASAYVRGSLGGDDLLPGLSDIDLALVLAEDSRGPGAARSRARSRWQRVRRVLPLTDLLLDFPLILERGVLRETVGASALTFDGAAYYGPGFSEDRERMLERPGLYDATSDWRLLRGGEVRPPEPTRDAQDRRIAAWLELAYWWQWVAPACADPGPRTASLCVKLVAEPARILLWLAYGERAGNRTDVLTRALTLLPEEREGIELALALQRSLPDSPDPPLAQVLPVLARLSERIAGLLADEVAEEGTTEVRLAGDPSDLILPHGPEAAREPLPLCDWRALVRPRLPDETFSLVPGDLAVPADLVGAEAGYVYGPLPTLRTRDLMLPVGPRTRTELRGLASRLTAPVSFALADGRDAAAFPNVRGWSVEDTARRAVAEHRAWLLADRRPVSGLKPGHAAGGVLAMLLSAARAAVFHQSIVAGAPELPLTVAEAARRLDATDAFEQYREFASGGRRPPDREVVEATGRLVLDALGDVPGLLAVEP